MGDTAERSATYSVILERYRPAYKGAANLAKAARICQRWVAPVLVALGVLVLAQGLVFEMASGTAPIPASAGEDIVLGSLVGAFVLVCVGALLSFISSNMQSRLDATVFQTPGLSDEEKLTLVTEVRAGLVIAPSAAVAHAAPSAPESGS